MIRHMLLILALSVTGCSIGPRMAANRAVELEYAKITARNAVQQTLTCGSRADDLARALGELGRIGSPLTPDQIKAVHESVNKVRVRNGYKPVKLVKLAKQTPTPTPTPKTKPAVKKE